MSRINVDKVGSEWVATCEHVDSVWTIHRGNHYNAWRSLTAHIRSEHGAHPDVMIGRR